MVTDLFLRDKNASFFEYRVYLGNGEFIARKGLFVV